MIDNSEKQENNSDSYRLFSNINTYLQQLQNYYLDHSVRSRRKTK
jgi:hypothetical protein